MQTNNNELLLELAYAHDDKLALAVRSAICRGIPKDASDDVKAVMEALGVTKMNAAAISTAKLRDALEQLGLRVTEDPAEHAEYGQKPLKHIPARVMVLDPTNVLETMPAEEFERSERKPVLVAMSASDSPKEALLHAMLGYLRECDIEQLGYIVPLEFHRVDAAKINVVTLNGRTFSDGEVATLKAYLIKKREAKVAP